MIPSLLAMALFAASSVSARRSVGVFGPATANFLRQILAVMLLVGLVAGLGSGFSGPALAWFLGSGIVGYGLGDAGVFLALPRLGSRLTSLMTQCLAAPIGALLEWGWRGQAPGGMQLAAGATILTGVALALVPRRGTSWAGPEWRSGIVFGLLAALGQSRFVPPCPRGAGGCWPMPWPVRPSAWSATNGRWRGTRFPRCCPWWPWCRWP